MTDTDKVSLEEAQKVSVSPPREDTTELDIFKLEHEERTQQATIGAVGKWFGAGAEKPGNISAILALLVLLYLFALTTWLHNHEHFIELVGLAFSIITLILGYIFGSSSPRN